MSAAEYDARYTRGSRNHDFYPPNAGAVRGTRVEYSSIEAFIRDYGVHLDRLGGWDGKYLGLRPDGVSIDFESRGLPISALKENLQTYEFTGVLPGMWKIEISEIAPAFGREGGGMQLLTRTDSKLGEAREGL